MIRAIIVDDEKPALDKLCKMATETGAVFVLGAFAEPFQALDFIRDNQVDLAFLDVDMPRIDGLALAERIMDIAPNISIVFVTAFSEYAVEAFRIHAIDYLLKPVENKRLLESISRITKSSAPQQSDDVIDAACFGGFRISVGGKQIKFRTAKAEELLACLIDSCGEPIHRNRITDIFWGDYDGDRALVLFNTTLHYLKKAFLNHGVKLKVHHSRGAYSLDMQQISCDAIKFENIVKSTGGVNGQNVRNYEEALKLYKGNYFEQNEYEWCIQKRQLFTEKYSRLVLAATEYYLGRNAKQQAAEILMAALVFDPLNKQLNHKLLELLRGEKDRVSLIKHYNLYRDRLRAEYGEEPDEEIKKLIKIE